MVFGEKYGMVWESFTNFWQIPKKLEIFEKILKCFGKYALEENLSGLLKNSTGFVSRMLGIF